MKPPLIFLISTFISINTALFSQTFVADSLNLRAENIPSVKNAISVTYKGKTIAGETNTPVDSAANVLKIPTKPKFSLKRKAENVAEKANILTNSTANVLKTTTIPSLSRNLFQDLFYQLALNFDLMRGNQNYANIIPQLDLGFENSLVGLNSNMLYNFSRLNGTQLNSDLVARNTVSFSPKSKMPIQLLGGAETSKIRNLPGRYQTGLGVGFNLLRKENHHVRASVNGVFDRSRFNSSLFKNDPEQTSNVRTVLGPLFQLIGHHTLAQGHILFTYDVSTLRALNHKNDYRLNAISSLSFPILKGISLRSSLIYSHESVIVQNTKHIDLFMTMGLGIGQF
jgi:hypothetical protein